jgi:hypothetical protein
VARWDMGENQYRTLINGRTDTMWAAFKDKTSDELLADLRVRQAKGLYLMAGDIAALRAALEPGQTVADLGKPRLRQILDERFEYVANEHAEGRT